MSPYRFIAIVLSFSHNHALYVELRILAAPYGIVRSLAREFSLTGVSYITVRNRTVLYIYRQTACIDSQSAYPLISYYRDMRILS